LRLIFDETPWVFQGSFTGGQAMDLLSCNHSAVQVVICEETLPDGDWKWVLAELHKAPVRASLIVSSRLADERLWAEVLNLGAFDLVSGDPFDPEEVLRVSESAWRASTFGCEPEIVRAPPKRLPRPQIQDGRVLFSAV
jgi:DNA-binding NarL/FixJ family response regulator